MGRYEQIKSGDGNSASDCSVALFRSSEAEIKAAKKLGTAVVGETRALPPIPALGALPAMGGEIPTLLSRSWNETCHGFDRMPVDEKAGWVAIGVMSVGLAVASRGEVSPVAAQREILAGEQLVSRSVTAVRNGFSWGIQESYKLGSGAKNSFWLDAETANGRRAMAELVRAQKEAEVMRLRQ